MYHIYTHSNFWVSVAVQKPRRARAIWRRSFTISQYTSWTVGKDIKHIRSNYRYEELKYGNETWWQNIDLNYTVHCININSTFIPLCILWLLSTHADVSVVATVPILKQAPYGLVTRNLDKLNMKHMSTQKFSAFGLCSHTVTEWSIRLCKSWKQKQSLTCNSLCHPWIYAAPLPWNASSNNWRNPKIQQQLTLLLLLMLNEDVCYALLFFLMLSLI